MEVVNPDLPIPRNCIYGLHSAETAAGALAPIVISHRYLTRPESVVNALSSISGGASLSADAGGPTRKSADVSELDGDVGTPLLGNPIGWQPQYGQPCVQ